jgi:hypothetical protein
LGCEDSKRAFAWILRSGLTSVDWSRWPGPLFRKISFDWASESVGYHHGDESVFRV